MSPRSGGRGGWSAWLAALLPVVALASCRLPLPLPEGAQLSGATLGSRGGLVLSDARGYLYFVDAADFAVREDGGLQFWYEDMGDFSFTGGVTMTNAASNLLYLLDVSTSTILEYDMREQRKVVRQFQLQGLETGDDGRPAAGALTWAPARASAQGGYFYVGSQVSGRVFIYELPLRDRTGGKAMAQLVSTWAPLEGSRDITGLSVSHGLLFVNYDDGSANHVLIFPLLESGLPGMLLEQYEVDVPDAQGVAVQRLSNETWEVFFPSAADGAVYAYDFHFVTGFELHRHCAGIRAKGSATSVGRSSWLAVALLLALLVVPHRGRRTPYLS